MGLLGFTNKKSSQNSVRNAMRKLVPNSGSFDNGIGSTGKSDTPSKAATTLRKTVSKTTKSLSIPIASDEDAKAHDVTDGTAETSAGTATSTRIQLGSQPMTPRKGDIVLAPPNTPVKRRISEFLTPETPETLAKRLKPDTSYAGSRDFQQDITENSRGMMTPAGQITGSPESSLANSIGTARKPRRKPEEIAADKAKKETNKAVKEAEKARKCKEKADKMVEKLKVKAEKDVIKAAKEASKAAKAAIRQRTKVVSSSLFNAAIQQDAGEGFGGAQPVKSKSRTSNGTEDSAAVKQTSSFTAISQE